MYHATLPNMNYADIVNDANIVENIFFLFGLRLQLRRRSFFKRLSWPSPVDLNDDEAINQPKSTDSRYHSDRIKHPRKSVLQKLSPRGGAY